MICSPHTSVLNLAQGCDGEKPAASQPQCRIDALSLHQCMVENKSAVWKIGQAVHVLSIDGPCVVLEYRVPRYLPLMCSNQVLHVVHLETTVR